MRILDPNADDPENPEVVREANMHLRFEKTKIKGISFYKVSVVKQLTENIYLSVHGSNLGLIPDLPESEELLTNLRTLFDQGKLLLNHYVPIECCQVSLKKNFEYWADDNSGLKFNKMFREIQQALN